MPEDEEPDVDPSPQLPRHEGINLKHATKVIELITSADPGEVEKAYTRATVAILAYICEVMDFDISEVDRQ